MSFRFWRRIRIAPGVTLNLNKSGGSLSFGPRGAKFTISPRGRRVTAGIPGTGLFYTTRLPGGGAGGDRRATGSASPVPRCKNRLTLGFFKRLVTSDDEAAFVDGCRELALGDEARAYEHLKQAAELADGAYLAGFLALKLSRISEAERFFTTAADRCEELGRLFTKYGIAAEMTLPITGEVAAHVSCNREGVLLGLVEASQEQGKLEEAMRFLETLMRLYPDDPVIKLSMCELLLERDGGGRDAAKRVIHLAQKVENESPVHAALLLYKARALRRLGLHEAAKDVLTLAMRRRKGRSEELLRALRYERVLALIDLGRKARARRELERIYAQSPDYADVAGRLGL